jgi:hypothetical protein
MVGRVRRGQPRPDDELELLEVLLSNPEYADEILSRYSGEARRDLWERSAALQARRVVAQRMTVASQGGPGDKTALLAASITAAVVAAFVGARQGVWALVPGAIVLIAVGALIETFRREARERLRSSGR